jgi:glycosyltransferase involved in cell wall biosynthesis
LPVPIRGSGGHRTLFQNIGALAAAGWECHVYFEPGGTREAVDEWLGPVPATFHEGFALDRDVDVAFATAWFTAEPLRHERRARHKAYFIQDYEALFQPMGDSFVRAQNSFRYGFSGIAIGRWLPMRLGRELGVSCSHFDFCADHSIYRPLDVPREPAICFLWQPDKPRRCSRLGAEALAIVKRERPEVNVYLYGSDEPGEVPFDARRLGLVSVEECAELYNRCAVGLCISTTNPSRVPFEMMACGLPVVDLHAENNRFDLPDGAALLAEPTPESLARALLQLLDDPGQRSARSRAGLAFMRERDLAAGYGQLVSFVERLVAGGAPGPIAEPAPLYTRPAVTASPADVERWADVLAHFDGSPSSSLEEESSTANGSSLLTRTRRRLEHTLRVLLTGR